MMRQTRASGIPRLIPQILFWAGLGLFGLGFVYNTMWHAASLGSSQLVWLLLLAAAVAAVLKWVGGKWLGRISMATALLAVGLVALMYFAGVVPVLTVVLVGLTALGVGSVLVPVQWQAHAPLSLVVGLALMCGVDGWLLPFRMHFRVVYLVISCR